MVEADILGGRIWGLSWKWSMVVERDFLVCLIVYKIKLMHFMSILN